MDAGAVADRGRHPPLREKSSKKLADLLAVSRGRHRVFTDAYGSPSSGVEKHAATVPRHGRGPVELGFNAAINFLIEALVAE